MAKPELGTKRDCPSCGTKFYDLAKNPVVCPKCGHEFVPDLTAKPKRAKAPEKVKEKPAARVRPKTIIDEDDPDSVSLDELRDQELAEDDIDDDLLVIDADADEEDAADDTFLPDDEDGDDVSDLLRGGHEDDEEI
ncbi:MAG: TIGR02300 family protein [Parvibaculaceae bacterium]|nr:TIGR02300 family protein [Parvibaculaceae bacterium]